MVDMVGCGQGMSCLSLQPLRQRKVLAADHGGPRLMQRRPLSSPFHTTEPYHKPRRCKLAGAVRVALVSRDDTTAASRPSVHDSGCEILCLIPTDLVTLWFPSRLSHRLSCGQFSGVDLGCVVSHSWLRSLLSEIRGAGERTAPSGR